VELKKLTKKKKATLWRVCERKKITFRHTEREREREREVNNKVVLKQGKRRQGPRGLLQCCGGMMRRFKGKVA
jgi:hypothetical protein